MAKLSIMFSLGFRACLLEAVGSFRDALSNKISGTFHWM